MCPHCKTEDVFFQAVEPVLITPTIHNWKQLSADAQIPKNQIYFCVDCEKLVKIDLIHKHITPLESDPIFDSTVEKILALAKSPEKRDQFISKNVVDALKSRRFIGIHLLLTGKELVVKIIEQKP